MSVRGAVAPAALPLQNARVVVVMDNSMAYASNLTARGRFGMTVPAGHAFRVYIANNEAPTRQRLIGEVFVNKHSLLRARGSIVNFGSLHVAGTALAPHAAGVKVDIDGPDGAGPDQPELPGVVTDTDDFCGTNVTALDPSGTTDGAGGTELSPITDPDESTPATTLDKNELSAKGPCKKAADAGE